VLLNQSIPMLLEWCSPAPPELNRYVAFLDFGTASQHRKDNAPDGTRYNTRWGMTCFQKGDYWANPDSWTQDDVKKAGIGIDDVFQRAKQLL
jgi:hypothetical protein